MDNAALALFLREAIDDENSLALLEVGRDGDARAVRVHVQRGRMIAKRLIVRRASVHDHGNMKGESAAAANVAAGFRLLYGSRHTSNTITPLQGVAQACVSENAPAPEHQLGPRRSAQPDASVWREAYRRGNRSRKVMPSQAIDSSS